MNNFKKYPSYKDSENEWIGNIPDHWDSLLLNFAFKENKEKNKGSIKSNILSLSYGELIIKKGQENFGLIPESFDTYQIINPGYLVFRFTDLQNDQKSLRVGHANLRGIITSAYLGLIPRDNRIHSKYFYYLFHSLDIKKYFYSFGGGVRLSLDWSTLKKNKYPLPPYPEQTAIANFLDKKTTEIKEFIALKERTIELLKERKMAIINQAVTKGLDPTVEMKDSGIEWLGEIPKHWEKVRIGHYVNVFRGASPRPAGDPTLFGGDFIPWITVSEVTKKGEKYLHETETYLTQLGAKQSRIVLPEMLLLSNSGASLGVPKITLIKGCFNDGSVAFNKYSTKLLRDFLYHFFNSHTEIYRKEMAGYGQPNLNTDIIKSTKIPLPPIDEQIRICAFIDHKTEEFNEIIEQTEREIEVIKEYQQSLISEVVTGKVDVRENKQVL